MTTTSVIPHDRLHVANDLEQAIHSGAQAIREGARMPRTTPLIPTQMRGLDELGKMSAEAVLTQYEAAAKAVEDMGKEVTAMVRKLGQSLLGVVENMSAYACPCCGEETAPFGRGGGRTLAADLGVPLLAEIPLEPVLREGADAGEPVVESHPEAASAQAIAALAARIDSVQAHRPAMPTSPLQVIRG